MLFSPGPKVILLPQRTTTKRYCKTMSTSMQSNITSCEKMYQALPPLFPGGSKVISELFHRREGPRLHLTPLYTLYTHSFCEGDPIHLAKMPHSDLKQHSIKAAQPVKLVKHSSMLQYNIIHFDHGLISHIHVHVHEGSSVGRASA